MAALIKAQHEGPLEASESLVSSILSVESFFDFMEESSRSLDGMQLSENGGGGGGGGGGAICRGEAINHRATAQSNRRAMTWRKF